MLNIIPNTPLKETTTYLSQFPRFSLIEKIEPKFFMTASEGARKAAEAIKETIIAKNKEGKTCVLGLATGNTPLTVYK